MSDAEESKNTTSGISQSCNPISTIEYCKNKYVIMFDGKPDTLKVSY